MEPAHIAAMQAAQPPAIQTLWTTIATYLRLSDALAAGQASKTWQNTVNKASLWSDAEVARARHAVDACEAAAAAARAQANAQPSRYRRSRIMELEDRPAYRNFVSGEVGALSLARVLGACRLPANATFADLGSGTGRPLVYAASLGPFADVVGLELLDGYVRSSRETLAHLKKGACDWRVVHGDFVAPAGAAAWAGADFVLAASTCFDAAQMARIAARAAALRPGAWVVTLDRALPSSVFTVECVVACPDCSWGTARAFVQRRM